MIEGVEAEGYIDVRSDIRDTTGLCYAVIAHPQGGQKSGRTLRLSIRPCRAKKAQRGEPDESGPSCSPRSRAFSLLTTRPSAFSLSPLKPCFSPPPRGSRGVWPGIRECESERARQRRGWPIVLPPTRPPQSGLPPPFHSATAPRGLNERPSNLPRRPREKRAARCSAPIGRGRRSIGCF